MRFGLFGSAAARRGSGEFDSQEDTATSSLQYRGEALGFTARSSSSHHLPLRQFATINSSMLRRRSNPSTGHRVMVLRGTIQCCWRNRPPRSIL